MSGTIVIQVAGVGSRHRRPIHLDLPAGHVTEVDVTGNPARAHERG